MSDSNPSGLCPMCGGEASSREKSPEGNTVCENGHQTPNRSWMKTQTQAVVEEDTGRGTNAYRLNAILTELGKRFPDAHGIFTSHPAESSYLAAIDALIADQQKAGPLIDAVKVWALCPHSGSYDYDENDDCEVAAIEDTCESLWVALADYLGLDQLPGEGMSWTVSEMRVELDKAVNRKKWPVGHPLHPDTPPETSYATLVQYKEVAGSEVVDAIAAGYPLQVWHRYVGEWIDLPAKDAGDGTGIMWDILFSNGGAARAVISPPSITNAKPIV